MEPPYAERHVRWCERTHGGLIPMLLLDFILENISEITFADKNGSAIIISIILSVRLTILSGIQNVGFFGEKFANLINSV